MLGIALPRILTYARRQDAGLTRVFIGPRRTRVLRVLASAETPLSTAAIAHAAQCHFTAAQALLEHLERAGYTTSWWASGEDRIRVHALTHRGTPVVRFLLDGTPVA